MLQLTQNLKTGKVEIGEVPSPAVISGTILVRNHFSLISSGTERMLLDFGRSSYLNKARQHPDKVKLMLEKIKTDGLWSTLSAVTNKLDQPVPMGYSCAGEVIDVGAGVVDFKIGDRVAGNGYHASVARVPQNVCVKIPDGVDYDEAAFGVVGSISMQGIRLAQPSLGECFVVTGLGLLGLVCLQLLRAHGCRVLGIDFDPQKLALAQHFGAEVVNLSADEDPVATAKVFSRGRGVDGVIVCAGSKSSEMINQAAEMCRMRGRVIQIGVTGLELNREKFFRKEILLQVSNSTGPGKSDPTYENQGIDYPIGFVRWTEQRNLEAVLDMIMVGQLNIKSLISHRFPITKAEAAYAVICGSEPSLGILLDYPTREEKPDAVVRESTIRLADPQRLTGSGRPPSVSFVGSGNYATAVLIPAFKAASARMRSVASSAGVSGVHAGKKFGFEETTTDTNRLFADPEVDAVVITTRHNSHARFVLQALEASKHVFVEKPLCLNLEELDEIEAAHARLTDQGKAPLVMVGFNRRFAPQVQRIKTLLAGVSGPKSFVMMVNAGAIPSDHWAQDPEVGGGRIIGEACHFIDLLRFLAGSPIVAHSRLAMTSANDDTLSLQLGFADGSIGTVHYFANGCKAFPKERLEVFAAGRVLQLDNFRRLKGFGWPGFKKMNLWKQDKGQTDCVRHFLAAIVEGGKTPIPIDEVFEVSRVSIEAASLLRRQHTSASPRLS